MMADKDASAVVPVHDDSYKPHPVAALRGWAVEQEVRDVDYHLRGMMAETLPLDPVLVERLTKGRRV